MRSATSGWSWLAHQPNQLFCHSPRLSRVRRLSAPRFQKPKVASHPSSAVACHRVVKRITCESQRRKKLVPCVGASVPLCDGTGGRRADSGIRIALRERSPWRSRVTSLSEAPKAPGCNDSTSPITDEIVWPHEIVSLRVVFGDHAAGDKQGAVPRRWEWRLDAKESLTDDERHLTRHGRIMRLPHSKRARLAVAEDQSWNTPRPGEAKNLAITEVDHHLVRREIENRQRLLLVGARHAHHFVDLGSRSAGSPTAPPNRMARFHDARCAPRKQRDGADQRRQRSRSLGNYTCSADNG